MNAEPKEFAANGVEEKEIDLLICDALAPLALPPARGNELRSRLLQRAADSARRHAGLITVRAGDGSWRAVKSGVRAKILHRRANDSSVLIEFAPGAVLPVHRHRHLEEGIVLSGSLHLANLQLGVGDYHVSPPGSRHGRISSPTGGLAYLRGTALGHPKAVIGEWLGGLLPGRGPAVHTIFATGNKWEEIAEGVEQKVVWREGEHVSRFLRLAAGSRLPPHTHRSEEETLIVSGDMFIGDLLVRAGEFHWAPAGSEHGEISSDVGALAFVRGHL